MFDNDPGHPDWEMIRSVQRKFSIGAVIVFVAVVLLNFVGTQPPKIWAQNPDAEIVLALK
jgi:protein-S-isoprenylcysteine O-methyltransferase Ste14